MHIEFKSNKLRERCEKFSEAEKSWGLVVARKLFQRLAEIKAATTLKDLNHLPPTKCHPLKGNRKGQYSVALDGTRCLIFEPLCDDKTYNINSVLDLSMVSRVNIIEVVNYHG